MPWGDRQTGSTPSDRGYTVRPGIHRQTGDTPSDRGYTVRPGAHRQTGGTPSDRGYTVRPGVHLQTGGTPSDRGHTFRHYLGWGPGRAPGISGPPSRPLPGVGPFVASPRGNSAHEPTRFSPCGLSTSVPHAGDEIGESTDKEVFSLVGIPQTRFSDFEHAQE
jgi:hypothetical protein